MTTAFRASRVDMLQGGVPTDYVDALLDDRYMADLIERTNQRMDKRADKMKNYFLMQKLIFWILCAQALLGVWVALYKTLLQPDIIWGANADLENVDLVLMLDASKPTSHALDIQHLAARNFTGMLQNAMLENKRTLKKREKARITEKQSEDSIMASLLPFLRYIRPKQPKGLVKVKGGGLRVATGIFNAERAELLHDFSGNISVQQQALASVGEDDYRSVAFWLPALDVCRQAAAHAGEKHARYCAIIGDDSAMCTRVAARPVQSHCRKWPGLCPPEEDLEFLGDGFLEYAREMDTCTTFVRDQMDAAPALLKTIMMFTVGSEEEGQLRLKNPGFQSFIKATTECEITKKTRRLVSEDGNVSVLERFEEDEGCVRFIMGNGFDDLMSKSARIADLLKDTSQAFSMTNDGHDPRYIFFLLLPLNLLFYLLWSKILRCTDRIKTQTARAMGRKKKVVKVTKFLVEKPEPPTVLQQRHAQLSEVELAELASLQPLVEFGAPMTLRARLKGGYLRADPQAGAPDGNGHAFDPMSNWTFELVGDADGEGGHGHRVRVRNARGELLVADEAGTRFAPAPAEGTPPGADGAAAGAAAEFLLEQAEGDAACHLGDAVQLLSCGTGGYLRVQKDGTCDAKGRASEHETQFVVDRGGPSVSSGSVVTLTSALTGGFMRGTPSGAVSALPGGEEWRFWKIEKKADAGEGGQGRPEGQGGAAPSAPHAHLKQGDVITLTAFNQHKLEVGKNGRVRCGGPSSGAMETVREDAEEGVGEVAPEAQLSQEFVIERVGMGTVRKHDNTLRAGMQVCLRPLLRGARGSGGEGAEGSADYLRVNGDGSVSPDGRVTQREITLTMDLAKMYDMVRPLHGTLQKGDVDLLVSPLWNKADIKKVNAMSSNWTNEEDLAHFKGPVVVASDRGTYAVPKAKGVDSGWVAVVNEGVDIRKAAKQAKLQGATGLIVRCEDVLSLEKMARKGAGAAAPELPAVFVDHAAGEQLDERGIVLNGCEFRKRYVTDAVRALGSIAAHLTPGAGGGEHPDVFQALGQGMLEQDRERQEEAEAQAAAGPEALEEEEGNYKWKVTSNTHYLWGKSGGGAAKMDVNFGSAAPPSAVQRTKLYADASGSRQRRPSAPAVEPRRSVTGVAVLEAEDVKSRRLDSELSNVLRAEEVSASEPLEQLAEESDFKIEYKFEEVEVAAGEQLEDVEEQEIMGEQEAVIAKFGVPRRRFWLVAAGLLLSTSLLATFLCYTLFTEFPVQDLPGFAEEEEEAWAAPGPLLPPARLASFLAA